MSKTSTYYLLTWNTLVITIFGPYNDYEECKRDGDAWSYENDDNMSWQIVKATDKTMDIKLCPKRNTL